MVKWIILGILLLITAFLILPLGAHVDYNDGDIKVYFCLFFFKIKLYDSTKPKKQKKSKPQKATTSAVKQTKPKQKRKIPWEFIKNTPPIVKLFFQKLRVSKVSLTVAVGGEDPFQTGVTFGTLSAVAYPIIGFFHSLKHIKIKHCNIYPDFLSEKTRIKASFRAKISPIYILKILMLAVYHLSKTANTTNEKEGNDNGKSVNSGNTLNING